MNTTKAMTATMKTSRPRMANRLRWPVWMSSTSPNAACGRLTTMPAKMISEMPLPMPRSEICSPSHMMNAVPVVRVRMVMMGKPIPHNAS
jgi:hypothetical protein